jgi:hypothetical protein
MECGKKSLGDGVGDAVGGQEWEVGGAGFFKMQRREDSGTTWTGVKVR